MAGGKGRRGMGKALGNLELVLGSLLLRVVGAGRRKNGNSLSQPCLSSALPDAALGDAGADAALWTAADPGWGPHPGWAALLSDLPGGCGPLCASESEAHACFPFPTLFFSLGRLGLGLYWFSLKIENKTKSQLIVL